MNLKNLWGHLRTVQTHRKWVRHYCFLAGIPWRGITHDLSKYSPVEFFESARYWDGISSPIERAKKDLGLSRAWQHHKGRNKHHWAYWTDKYSSGTVTYPMSEKDFTEMVCDFLGAGRAYMGVDFTYAKEYDWWTRDKETKNKGMNEKDKDAMETVLYTLKRRETEGSFPTPEEAIHDRRLIHRAYVLSRLEKTDV